MKNVHAPSLLKSNSNFSDTASRYVLGALAAVTVLPLATRADDPAPIAAPPPSKVDALVNFEFSDKYLTPRGMIVNNDGLDFQVLVLGFVNLYKSDKFINNVTLVPGVWNDFSSSPLYVHAGGVGPKTDWIEIDPIAGVSIGFAKNFKLDVTYTAFCEQFNDLGTSQHLDTKLSFDDSSYLKAFALHPYFEYWQELIGKSTAAQGPFFVPAIGGPKTGPGGVPGSSYYFEVGVAPSYTFDKIGLKLELPCRVLLPNKEFYGEYYAPSSTVGLYEVGIKGTVPLKFMPEGYGHWSFHAGFKYVGFEDKNLQGMQRFNAPGNPVKDTVQFYCGISTFF